MKTSIIVTIALIMIATTSFQLYRTEAEPKEKVGLQVITALQHASVHEYSALFPSMADFHALMTKNAELYGKNLSEAAREFEKEYDLELYPAFEESFERILLEGKQKGIDWRTVRLVSVEAPEEIVGDFASVPMTITFTAQGKDYRLNIEKVLVMDGRWKVSHFIHFEE